MRLISVPMPEAWLERIEELVRAGTFPSRAACIRYAVWKLLHELRDVVPPPEVVYCPYCNHQMTRVGEGSFKCPMCGSHFRLKHIRR